MKPSEILVEAKRLLVEKGWTQGAYARDKYGRMQEIPNAGATCFCAYGALMVASNAPRASDPIFTETYGFMDVVCGGSVAKFNDAEGRTKEEMLATFDKAIALAEAVKV